MIIHHVTMNDYRIPSEMYKAKGAKVIWGPMGGAQVTPKPLKVYEKNQFAAAFREFVNKSCSWNPFYKKALRSYYKIYCINNETQKANFSHRRKRCAINAGVGIKEMNTKIFLFRKETTIFSKLFL